MKTAFQTAEGYKAATATLDTLFGCITVALHKSPSTAACGWCWAVTDPRTGKAFARSNTSRQAALDLAFSRIEKAGLARVQAVLAAEPDAPAVETLPVWTPPAKAEAATKVDIPHIVDLVAKTVGGLTDREKTAVARALNSRTGQLKAKSPSAFGDDDERLACAAWQGLQPNAFKIGTLSVFSLRGESSELFEKLTKVSWPAAFDKDKLALVNAGVW